VLSQGRTLYRSPYVWYRLTTSSAAPEAATGLDRLVFESATQAGPFDLPGGSTWSREVLLVPQESWAAVAWPALAGQVAQACAPPARCRGEFTLRVRLDTGAVLAGQCAFDIDVHLRAHLGGQMRRFFTTPVCRAAVPQ